MRFFKFLNVSNKENLGTENFKSCLILILSFFVFLAVSLVRPQHPEAIQLKSYRPPSSLPSRSTDIVTCDFFMKTSHSKKINVKTENFKAKDLAYVHDDGTQGVFVNIFDFMGFNFSMDTDKNLVVQLEKEEIEKKQLKKFDRLPATFTAPVEFSVRHKSKTISMKEVSVVCKP